MEVLQLRKPTQLIKSSQNNKIKTFWNNKVSQLSCCATPTLNTASNESRFSRKIQTATSQLSMKLRENRKLESFLEAAIFPFEREKSAAGFEKEKIIISQPVGCRKKNRLYWNEENKRERQIILLSTWFAAAFCSKFKNKKTGCGLSLCFCFNSRCFY